MLAALAVASCTRSAVIAPDAGPPEVLSPDPCLAFASRDACCGVPECLWARVVDRENFCVSRARGCRSDDDCAAPRVCEAFASGCASIDACESGCNLALGGGAFCLAPGELP